MEQHLSQYRIFYAVAKTGNISKAAKELFISQPAISKAISKLEESLGLPLFTRNSRGVQLTVEGQVLFSHVSNAFDTLNRGENELRRIKDFNIGQLKIGVSNTLCKYVLLPYLKGFVEQNPHIKITIESQSTAKTVSMLEQQQLDIGLVAEPKSRRNLKFLPVMQINDGFVCTKSYLENLFLREGRDTDIFSEGTVMLLDRNNMSRAHVDTWFAENNVEPRHILEATTMDLIIEFAKIGLGIGCVIKDFVRKELEEGSLIEIPLASPIRRRTIGFSYNPSYVTKTTSQFVKFCMPEQN